jgi:O-acetyl-ADP-ribose deacetylase
VRPAWSLLPSPSVGTPFSGQRGGGGNNRTVPSIHAVHGDITTCRVDAVVNAANTRMRGGGGVDGAIHRVGGPAVLADCVARFPNGLATGDAGWTTAGDLPARWVIHTVGPNYNAGQRDRSLLESCYRRVLEVADELGVRSIGFPLISAGIYGWPLDDAIAAAVATIAATSTAVEEAQLVALDGEIVERIDAELARSTPLRILQGVQVLHRRGYHCVRILPGMSASGMHWRVSVSAAASLESNAGDPTPRGQDRVIDYTTGAGTQFAGANVSIVNSPDSVADIILEALPGLDADRTDAEYVRWYDELMELVAQHGSLPIAYADYFDDGPGWEVGWGSGTRLRHPPQRDS